MSNPNQPYNFGKLQAVIAKAGKIAQSKFKDRERAAKRTLAFHEDIHKMAVSHILKVEGQSQLIKEQLQAEVDRHNSLLANNTKNYEEMAGLVEPGSKIESTLSGFKAQVPFLPPKGDDEEKPKGDGEEKQDEVKDSTSAPTAKAPSKTSVKTTKTSSTKPPKITTKKASSKNPAAPKTDADGVIKPILDKPKPNPKKTPRQIDVKAGEAYND